MSLLLDTHALLWWLSDDPALKAEARQAIGQASNTIYVSAASAWEISIKKALGKLDAPNDLHGALLANHFEALPITTGHATSAGQLPRHHDDPFDRRYQSLQKYLLFCSSWCSVYLCQGKQQR